MSEPTANISIEAERAVLGAMLRSSVAVDDVVQIVREDDFYADANRRIFTLVTALRSKGEAVDVVTVHEALHNRGWEQDVRGDYLATLLDAAPTAANAERYALIVRDRAIKRRLEHTANAIAKDACDLGTPADEQLQAAEQKIFALAEMGVRGTAYPITEVLDRTYERVTARLQQQTGSGLPTGFGDLDNLTGGLQPGELILLAARPSVGKTSLALRITRHAAVEEGAPVFFASLEQSRLELGERLVCRESKVDSGRLRKGKLTQEEFDRFMGSRGVLDRCQIFTDDGAGQTVSRIAANARRHKARYGIRLLVIDYLGLIEPENRRDPRHEQVGNISRRLKQVARELHVPVLCLAQLNREVENRANSKPRLADLRDSGELEQNADTVLLLHRPDPQPGQTVEPVDAIVAKQRNGPTGTIVLDWLPRHYDYEAHVPNFPTIPE